METVENAFQEVDVIIEISPSQGPVKYEVDKDSGLLMVDRFLQTSMVYPCQYGYVPATLSDDGDPCDVLVMSPYDIIPGAVIRVRVCGMLVMEDEAGLDNKILAVPVDAVSSQYAHIQDIQDVDAGFLAKIEHFFKHYKDLDQSKWVKLKGWQDKAKAVAEIQKSQKAYQNQ